METILSTKLLLDGVLVGSNPKSINFVRGASLAVTESDGDFTVTIPSGSETYFQSGAPDAGTGISGDHSVDTATDSFYIKNGSSWILVVNNA